MPILFLDTGDIFPETIQYLSYLQRALDLEIQRYSHALDARDFDRNVKLLMESGLTSIDAFDELTKVRPMLQILRDFDAGIWISGNRRDQSLSRRDLPFAEIKNDVLKVYPLADSRGGDLAQFLQDRGLAPHPLSNRYRSVGNQRDTAPVNEGYEKAGRHSGTKEECGLHLGWVKRGKTLITSGDTVLPAASFPLMRLAID